MPALVKEYEQALDLGLSLNEWLAQTEQRRDALLAYGKSPLPMDAGERHTDLDLALNQSDEIGRIVHDAEWFLATDKKKALFEVLKTDLSASERKIVIDAEVAGIKRLLDGLKVTRQAIRDRLYINQNENRAGR
jgi:hypothetical protein